MTSQISLPEQSTIPYRLLVILIFFLKWICYGRICNEKNGNCSLKCKVLYFMRWVWHRSRRCPGLANHNMTSRNTKGMNFQWLSNYFGYEYHMNKYSFNTQIHPANLPQWVDIGPVSARCCQYRPDCNCRAGLSWHVNALIIRSEQNGRHFCRQHFRRHFVQWNSMNFNHSFISVCPRRSCWQ